MAARSSFSCARIGTANCEVTITPARAPPTPASTVFFIWRILSVPGTGIEAEQGARIDRLTSPPQLHIKGFRAGRVTSLPGRHQKFLGFRRAPAEKAQGCPERDEIA